MPEEELRWELRVFPESWGSSTGWLIDPTLAMLQRPARLPDDAWPAAQQWTEALQATEEDGTPGTEVEPWCGGTEDPPSLSSTDGSRKLIYLQELPGTDHCVFYCKDQRHGGLFRMGELIASAACRAGPLSPPLLTWSPHLQVGILTPTWRPWKNLRNSCSARDSQRGIFSCPYRWEAAFPNTRRPPGLHLQSPPCHQTWSPGRLDLPSSHEPSLTHPPDTK
ncbi:odorant-binding protein 2a [Sapajus apella]|uniref:Odorant-binding protein 2a n=1 Tax=Sapajus apella TaxID=9515 RepID=A0A6J3GK31_SAPAP|nr:odorant-binding protein 2a [Sapajus apella]